MKIKDLQKVTLKERLHDFLFKFDYGVIELLNGVLFTGFGAILLIGNRDTSALARAITGTPIEYNGINIVAFIMLAFGLVKFYALLRGSLKMRRNVGFFGCFIWTTVIVLMSEQTSAPAGIFFYSVMTIFSVWTFVRLVMRHNAHRLLDPRDPYANT